MPFTYSNARRAGRTNPDLVEIITPDDPRHPLHPGKAHKPNRADRRARVRLPGVGASRSQRARPTYRVCPTCQGVPNRLRFSRNICDACIKP